MLSARGRNLLFADADGATTFSDLDKLMEALSTINKDWKEGAVVIGSRAHLEQEAIATRSAFRYKYPVQLKKGYKTNDSIFFPEHSLCMVFISWFGYLLYVL